MNMKIPAMILVSFLLFVTPAISAPTTDVNIGGMIFSVSESRTAQVFHIVDQLSQWDQYAHKQYGRWAAKNLKLDQEDQQLLQKHAELRRVRGWGAGFEQAFLVDDSIDVAAVKAVQAKLLSPDEAATEKGILLHFASKLAVLCERGEAQIAAFKKRLIAQADKIKPLVQKLRRFAETQETVKVPVFLVTNPEEGSGGGEANAGRLVIEVQDKPDPLPFLFHESMHLVLNPHLPAIKAAAESAGLNWQVLNEGIAYALGPGLTDSSRESDSLVEALVRNVVQGKTASDNYTQFYMVASVIRPLLREALDKGETITTFLPKAVSKWRSVADR
jgi:hypothetical protein